ncbi:MAG: hypothetical protein E7480_01570 [Ruminococcaceae bacterium]|nr:hypothetical protein [Oscillospiraceae bacterium]
MFSKKICCFVILICFVLMLVPINVSADSIIYVAATPPATASQGQTIEVQINMSGAEKDVYGFDLSIQYNGEALEFVKEDSQARSEALFGFTTTCKNSGNEVQIISYPNDIEKFIPKNTWTIGKLVFKVKDTAALGNVSFSITKINGFTDYDSPEDMVAAPADAKTMQIIEKASNNANLSALSVKNYPLNVAFSTDKTTGYSITVPFDISSVDVEYTVSDAGAKASVTGNKNLKVGKNNVYVVVVAADKVTQKTYRVVVTRQPDPNAPPVSSEDNQTISSEAVSSEVISSDTTTPDFEDDIGYNDSYEALDKKYNQLQEKIIVIIIAFSMVIVAMGAYIIYLLMQRNR